MTIVHHPSDVLLTASAAGILGRAEHMTVATHVHGCARCREWVRVTEALGGAALENMTPAPMACDALSLLDTQRDPPPQPQQAPLSPALASLPGLPLFVRRYAVDAWKWIAPGLHVMPLDVPDTGDMRVFLLKSKPGLKLLPHNHTGVEMTCVLTGSFSHDGARFAPGDFDFGDAEADHAIAIGPEADCLCLVAMSGALKFKGLLGRLVQPFVSI